MNDINYYRFHLKLNDLGFGNSNIEEQAYSLKDIVEEESVVHFYPKNFFVKEFNINDVEAILVEDTKFRIIKFLENGFVEINNKSFEEIADIKIKHKNRGSTTLTIIFKDKDTFILDSESDGTHSHFKLQEIILNIYKHLK